MLTVNCGEGEARREEECETEKEILLYKWGGGSGGRAELGASLVARARGRTLNEVTLLVTALFFFSSCPTPGHHSRPQPSRSMVRPGPLICPVFTAA
jgi:hypothetical protein